MWISNSIEICKCRCLFKQKRDRYHRRRDEDEQNVLLIQMNENAEHET